jgi:hypothetical protein
MRPSSRRCACGPRGALVGADARAQGMRAKMITITSTAEVKGRFVSTGSAVKIKTARAPLDIEVDATAHAEGWPHVVELETSDACVLSAHKRILANKRPAAR